MAHSKVTPALEDDDDRIVKLKLSYPPKFRRTGGIFTKGPLSEVKRFTPGSNFFNSRGTLQADYPRYRIIQGKARQEKSRTQAFASVPAPESPPLRRSSREGNKNKPFSLPPRVFIRSGPTRPAVASDAFQELRAANRYEIGIFKNSKRPRNWPKDLEWPQDPTSIPTGEQRCDYCPKLFCTCIVDLMEGTRHLKVEPCGEKGRGLVAVATGEKYWKMTSKGVAFNKEGKVRVFEKNLILEQLKGLLVPDDKKYNDGWSSEIRREDLDKTPVSGRIYCRKEGNLMGLINHSCEPNCELFGSRFSGSYIQSIKTLRDIYDGEELTISYGRSYFTKKNPCKCDSKICIWRKQDAEDVGKSVSYKAGQKSNAMIDEPAPRKGGTRARVEGMRRLGEEFISASVGQKRKATEDEHTRGKGEKRTRVEAQLTPLGVSKGPSVGNRRSAKSYIS